MAVQQQQEVVINCFTNEGEGWLGKVSRSGRLSSCFFFSCGFLSYTGSIAAGKAQGRGTVRCEGGWTLRDADFRGGRMQPCSAVFAYHDGDAYAGPLTADCDPLNWACGACVRGADGGRFQGEWPAHGADNGLFHPCVGAAWDPRDGSVWMVKLDPRKDAEEGIESGGSGWGPGAHAGWHRLGVMELPTAQQVPTRPPPLRPVRAGCNRAGVIVGPAGV
jgi:hypothetical protein